MLKLFDVLVGHLPPGTHPGERTGFRLQCWVNSIPAEDSAAACEKATHFLSLQGKTGLRVKSWRYHLEAPRPGGEEEQCEFPST